MYIKLDDLIAKYGLNIRGVLHIGAHTCEEEPLYLKYITRENIIWLEANPKLVQDIIAKNTHIRVYNYAVSDKSGQSITLNVTNNGQSSSILNLSKHSLYYPDIVVTDKIKVPTIRLDDFMAAQGLDFADFNMINLDIQGAELLALQGAGDEISKFDIVYSEVNTEELYQGCCKLNEIDQYLRQYGFTRTDIYMTNEGWGDAVYINERILQINLNNLDNSHNSHNSHNSDNSHNSHNFANSSDSHNLNNLNNLNNLAKVMNCSNTYQSPGRWGNHFIRNMCAHILAKKYNLRFRYSYYDYFLKLGIELYTGGQNSFSTTKNLTDEEVYELLISDNKVVDYNISLDHIYCQTREICLFLKDYLPSNQNSNSNENVLIHVRVDDAAQFNPGYHYYDKVLATLKYNTGFITSDDIKHPICRKLITKYNLEIINLSELDTILFATQCQYLILSHGTYSWLMGLLSPAATVFYAKIKKIWHGDIFVYPQWQEIDYEEGLDATRVLHEVVSTNRCNGNYQVSLTAGLKLLHTELDLLTTGDKLLLLDDIFIAAFYLQQNYICLDALNRLDELCQLDTEVNKIFDQRAVHYITNTNYFWSRLSDKKCLLIHYNKSVDLLENDSLIKLLAQNYKIIVYNDNIKLSHKALCHRSVIILPTAYKNKLTLNPAEIISQLEIS